MPRVRAGGRAERAGPDPAGLHALARARRRRHRRGPRLAASPGHPPAPVVAPATARRIAAHHAAGGLVASVCAGAFALGQAGLLDGRRCTTHHELQDDLARHHRSATVVRDVLYVTDDRVVTSAGIASGIDLALHLVAARHGPATAARTARAMVVYARRNGDAPQAGAMLRHRAHLSDAVHRAQDLIDARYTSPLRLTDLAAAAGVSERTLTRRFTAATGLTPCATSRSSASNTPSASSAKAPPSRPPPTPSASPTPECSAASASVPVSPPPRPPHPPPPPTPSSSPLPPDPGFRLTPASRSRRRRRRPGPSHRRRRSPPRHPARADDLGAARLPAPSPFERPPSSLQALTAVRPIGHGAQERVRDNAPARTTWQTTIAPAALAAAYPSNRPPRPVRDNASAGTPRQIAAAPPAATRAGTPRKRTRSPTSRNALERRPPYSGQTSHANASERRRPHERAGTPHSARTRHISAPERRRLPRERFRNRLPRSAQAHSARTRLNAPSTPTRRRIRRCGRSSRLGRPRSAHAPMRPCAYAPMRP
ncbi:GlxA family transcriptional regulator [Actinomadura yumaensis]|uniref:GlxA family transcriptional regulator n=1 Tax=Actinomadura yumaensis TaxID=111807 RepID=UPI003614E1A3